METFIRIVGFLTQGWSVQPIRGRGSKVVAKPAFLPEESAASVHPLSFEDREAGQRCQDLPHG
ncbi:MAG: hypothetical protein D6795_21015 [Deltaproteobacteria bacterium]|nr:MAG: hypothetical protein D6795_21015 [Deltaproteobacteria bacterium]